MAELHVRNLPADLHERLREQAKADGRSLSAEVVAILRQALLDDDRPVRQRSAIDRLRGIQDRNRLPAHAPAAEQLVRADRNAAG